MSNGFKNMVKARKEEPGKRRRLDDYETPTDGAVPALLRFVKFAGPIFEPACGSGLMMRELRELTGHKVTGADIKKGQDYFKSQRVNKGDTITNPPYHKGMAERFARHALKLTDGKVAMLVQNGFLWGGKRANGLYAECKPEAVVILPERIYFLAGGKPIKAQFYSHCWVVWPDRAKRAKPNSYETRTYWAPAESEFD
jgi:hypothetical protein